MEMGWLKLKIIPQWQGSICHRLAEEVGACQPVGHRLRLAEEQGHEVPPALGRRVEAMQGVLGVRVARPPPEAILPAGDGADQVSQAALAQLGGLAQELRRRLGASADRGVQVGEELRRLGQITCRVAEVEEFGV